VIAQLDRTSIFGLSVMSTALVGGISGEAIGGIVTISGGVAAVVGALAWLDSRMEKKINAHAAEEKELHDARMQTLKAEIKLMFVERDP
jgi:outer membrane lipoprotein SlyB